VSRDSGVIDAVRRARDYDALPDASRRFNFQMTDLQAAIGRAQLRKLPGFLERREAIWRRYRAAGAVLLDGETPGARPVRFRAVVRTRSAVRWRQQLERAGVQTIIPVTAAELLAPASVLPNAHGLARETVSLPIHPGLSDQDVDRIEAAIRALVDA
jgi:perosamine synthetase